MCGGIYEGRKGKLLYKHYAEMPDSRSSGRLLVSGIPGDDRACRKVTLS